MKYQNILITGGCGFLGQHLIKSLTDKHPDVKIKVLDLNQSRCCIINHSNNKNIQTKINKDITDYNSIKDDFKNIDAVIHLAGIVSFSLKDKSLLKKVNVDGTRNVLKAAHENKVKHFLHISSVAALGYNDKKNHPVDEEFRFNWNIAKKRKKYYMLTKHLADNEVKRFTQKGLKTTVLYPGLMLGPGDITNSAKLINAIKENRVPFNMPGGTNIIDVRDVSEGIVRALEKDLVDTEKNDFLLSGHNITFKELNTIIATEVLTRPPKTTLPKILNPLMFRILLLAESISNKKLELTADNLDSAFKYRYFTNNKAKKHLDWQPKINFQKTIKDTINWMKEDGIIKK